MQQNEIASRGYIIPFEHGLARLERRDYAISFRRRNKHTNGMEERPNLVAFRSATKLTSATFRAQNGAYK